MKIEATPVATDTALEPQWTQGLRLHLLDINGWVVSATNTRAGPAAHCNPLQMDQPMSCLLRNSVDI